MKKIFWIIYCLCFIACSQVNEHLEYGQTIEETPNTGAGNDKIEHQDLSQNCGYDNKTQSLGIGLVLAPRTFEVYNDSQLTDRYVKWDVYSSDEPPRPICSKYYDPEYGIMHFVCLEKTKKYYKVLIGYDKIKYIQVAEEYEFKTWQEYILQSYGIRRSTEAAVGEFRNQPLHKAPNEVSGEIPIPEGLEMFCPLDIDNDWVKVTYDCFYNVEVDTHEGEPCHAYIDQCNDAVTGWIKWRYDNLILVDIFLRP